MMPAPAVKSVTARGMRWAYAAGKFLLWKILQRFSNLLHLEDQQALS
jgi:hypothetical protein